MKGRFRLAMTIIRRFFDLIRPILRRIPLLPTLYRRRNAAKTPLKLLWHDTKLVVRWIVKAKETTNYTYDLTDINKAYLSAFVAEITGKTYEEIAGYIAELETDTDLQKHIADTTATSDDRYVSHLVQHYGRRLGWYAFVRALKPKIVVETGVDKGLGAVVLISALMRNAQDGFEGYYYGTDIRPTAGYLLTKTYAAYGEILYGDSIESLQQLDQTIDLFINDSDHSATYEGREYVAIQEKLGSDAVILGDNAHVSEELLTFALKTGRRYLYFGEQPKDHWYRGAGIGVAFNEPST
jgi:predicted O-methyltransferase YrrM